MNVSGNGVTDGRNSTIRWAQIGALLGLDLAILLSWMAYNEYQPRLITKYGYGSHAFAFLVIQTLILVVTPPLAGHLTDRLCSRGGTRLAVVTVGVSLTAMVFMATAFTLMNPLTPWISTLFPGLIVLWLIAMNIFHSPAISMLELYSPPELLTGVAALFTLLAGITGALEPAMTSLIDTLGAPSTFAAGGAVILVSGLWFLRSSSTFEIRREHPGAELQETSGYVRMLGMGLVLGLIEAAMNDLLPLWVSERGDLVAGLNPAYQSSCLYTLAALAAWPLGRVGNRWTPNRLALAGGIAGLSLTTAAWAAPAGIAHGALWVLPAAFAALAVASLPVAFRSLLPQHRVLGVGLLFSGIELAGGLAKILLNL